MTTFELDRQYVAHTYNRFPLEIVGGEGAKVFGADGKDYIDLGSGIAVNIFGMNDAPWRDAVTAQLSRFAHTSNLYYNAPAAQLAQMLCARTGLKRVFFSNSGAEANECAIKVARKWAAVNKGAQYRNIITLKSSFHGRTLATLSATGQDAFHQDYQPLPGGFLYAQVGDAAGLEKLVKENPCAAIFFEAVQGEGGVTPIGQDFADALSRIARENDLLLLADEVQIGNGRSGQLYGYMHYGLSPDVVTTAKGLGGGLPIGATLLGDRVCDVFSPGDHGSTFGGNPVACAGAIHILSRIDEELLLQVREKSAYIFDAFKDAPGFDSVSGMGLMIGLAPKKPARELAELALQNGLLLTTAKQKLRLLPPLNIPMALLESAVQTLKRCAVQ
ncbi:MAG: aminotransferase class III-fold pyridoxal phosphate-dependent enzyme [Oscillospiraceae bacterium]|jgi:acetylornithine/N-succinyldiaminopimelate aminotransferase|nr:aminotransferase class III-fold pyridoxal phosphate-dependent enzyme [Oscillospiraceae bacterium]